MRLPSAPETDIDFTGENDADLLGYMGMRECELEARDAFAELYKRHAEWLYNVLLKRRMTRLVGGEEGAQDVLQITFILAFKKAHTFDAGNEGDPVSYRRRVRAWLGTIANNVTCNILRGSDALNRAIVDPNILDGVLERQPEGQSPKADLIRDVLETFSEREKDIILETTLYYKAGEGHQRLPNEASRELSRRWNTTTENIRAIRSRALRKIKAAIEDREPEARSQP
jgi:RNA polymerase sigma factor (sigma-70 family)